MQLAVQLDKSLMKHPETETQRVMSHEETLGCERVRRLQLGRQLFGIGRNQACACQLCQNIRQYLPTLLVRRSLA